MTVRPSRGPLGVASLLPLITAAALVGCDGGAPVVADADGPRPIPAAPAPVAPRGGPADAPVAPAPAVEPRPRREETPRREPSPRRDDLAPAREQADGTTTVMTDAGPDPFDPEIDPATLAPPEPVATPEPDRPPELKDFPLTAAIPPDRQAIPADLALPVGATLSYQDGRDWVEVELKAPADAVDADAAGAPPLRVHRTDRPAVILDVRIPRDQLIVPKLVVRRLRSARD